MRRKALAQEGMYVKYTGCQDSWRPAPVGQRLLALPGADGMRLLAIRPRSCIKPSAYFLASVHRRGTVLHRSAYRCGGTGDHVLAWIFHKL